MQRYDVLIVGAGLFGAVCARELTDAGKRVLVLEKRGHIAGNLYTEQIAGIHVHRYGPHIFHTNSDEAWRYACRFAEFAQYVHSPAANFKGEIYPLPFNMHTFRRLWGVSEPQQAAERIARQRGEFSGEPKNLEEQAVALVGRDLFEKLIRGYSEKQWGRPCSELPPEIIRRIPVRYAYDNNYFDARWQGIPRGGYTAMLERMLEGVEVLTEQDYLADKERWRGAARKVIFTGPIDAYFGYALGALEYRSVRFETQLLHERDFQGRAVVNYTDADTPWTRIIEHKWFAKGKDDLGRDLPDTVVSREYSAEWTKEAEPFYPIGDARNEALHARYRELAQKEKDVFFGGRLGEYRYYDMDQTILSALRLVKELLAREE